MANMNLTVRVRERRRDENSAVARRGVRRCGDGCGRGGC
ncbi:hypothetical protein BSU04_28900 [Caballeronia sordidicola]|uniref:Uncharacterized protein n=1 Tax=Caballeronia sordidicola TaxID=196367 RepID=A0A226WWK4_CABSO|nr:hypothetical protein BSU04_28900 [Caballeronia sordidicola]